MFDNEEFIDQRIAIAEQALADDPASDYNKFGEESDAIFHKILPHLTQIGDNERHLLFRYETVHNAMWVDVVEAAYVQGLKDGLALQKLIGPIPTEASSQTQTAYSNLPWLFDSPMDKPGVKG